MENIKDWNKANIATFLNHAMEQPDATTNGKKNTVIVYRMLQQLYARQTADEQATESTNHENGMGFTGVDAPILTSIAKSAQKYGNITAKQCSKIVAKRLVKYSGQLAKVAAAKQGKPVQPEPVQMKLHACYCNGQGSCDVCMGNAYAAYEAAQEAKAFMAGL